MKTATMPALRVNPKLRQAVERILRNGESLSSFVEASLYSHLNQRLSQEKFIARGLNAQKQAKQNNEYYAADQILAMLDDMLETKKGK